MSMPNCVKCGNEIETKIVVPGKRTIRVNRKTLCLSCKPHREKTRWSKEEFIEAVLSSKSFSEISIKLKILPTGGNNRTIKKYIKRYNLDGSHLSTTLQEERQKKKLVDIFTKDSKVARATIRRLILKYNLIDYRCAGCNLLQYTKNSAFWNGKEIVLQLEHKNGIYNDHRLLNLEFLCPNCHSQTATYAGKRRIESKDQASSEDNTLLEKIDRDTESALLQKNCAHCNTPFKSNNSRTRYCTPSCLRVASDNKKQERLRRRPAKEDLERLVKEMPLTEIAKNYDMTATGLRKWCLKYGIELPGRGYWTIQKYSRREDSNLHVPKGLASEASDLPD